jgi:hypothetical protein
MIRFSSPYRFLWDSFIILLALFKALVIPFEIAFNPGFMKTIGYEFIEYFIDVLFLIDILINFRTTILNKYGEEI